MCAGPKVPASCIVKEGCACASRAGASQLHTGSTAHTWFAEVCALKAVEMTWN